MTSVVVVLFLVPIVHEFKFWVCTFHHEKISFLKINSIVLKVWRGCCCFSYLWDLYRLPKCRCGFCCCFGHWYWIALCEGYQWVVDGWIIGGGCGTE